jgi:hypothetical protein
MNLLPFLFAPLLLLPTAQGSERNGHASAGLSEPLRSQATGLGPVGASPFDWLVKPWETQTARQVSIEQHIIIRITPRFRAANDPRIGMFSQNLDTAAAPRIEERKMGKCVALDGVAGVQITPANRLVLFLRDNRVVSAGLDKGCSARDFYSGFYVARSGDGMMCTGRDTLQSRNGASCKLGKLHQLIAVDDN